jgi:mRNA interferase HigB
MRYNKLMRVISNKKLVDFSKNHSGSGKLLQAWRKIIESKEFNNFAELKSSFNSVDKVMDYYIFNIGGNNYRIIAAIYFKTQTLFIREILTHKEYDRWKPL